MDFLPLIQKSQEIRDNTFKPVLNTIKRFIKAAISSRKDEIYYTIPYYITGKPTYNTEEIVEWLREKLDEIHIGMEYPGYGQVIRIFWCNKDITEKTKELKIEFDTSVPFAETLLRANLIKAANPESTSGRGRGRGRGRGGRPKKVDPIIKINKI